MIFTETELTGAFILDVEKIEDERGFFGRTFCQKEFEKRGLETQIAQANMSYNKEKGTVRGMHYQVAPYQETKLVKCTSGSIFDIIIDLREASSTYGKWVGVELSAGNNRMLYVPKDFAHGFITLEDHTSIQYLVSQFYTPGSERGIRWDDPKFDLKWPIEVAVISEKDNSHPYFDS